MSNARKLQTEIDRVLKKVDEGVELFDEIWEKVYSAEQQSQKEKHEQDLKKEIKKLQRLRDQIKTWIGSSEVKDKDALLEARRLIETKMEQFKVCEKETKTKTYSKEGLAREEKLDPAEEAKRNTTGWITDYIERLRQLVQDREVEIERLQAGKGKKTNKHIIDEYNSFILNHKFHVSKLEGIMRLVNNDRLDPESVDSVKDDLDYYIDSYEEDEYQNMYDEDSFYESLGLDELDVVVVDRVTQVAPPAVKKASNDDSGSQASSNMSNKDTSKKSNKKTPAATVIPLTIGRARVTSTGEVKPGVGPPIIGTTTPLIATPPLTTSTSSTPPSVISTVAAAATTAPVLQASVSVSAATSPTVLPASLTNTTPTKLGRASTTGGAGVTNSVSAAAVSVAANNNHATTSTTAAPAVLPTSSNATGGRTTPTPNAGATGGASMAAILKRESEQQQEKERQKALQQAQQQQQLLRDQHARNAEQLRLQQQQQQQLRQQQEAQQQLQRQQQQQEALRQQKAAVAAAQQEALQRQQQEQALRQQQQEAAAKQAQLQQQAVEKLQQQQQQQQQQQRSQASQQVGLDILASGLGSLTLGNTDGQREPPNLGTSAITASAVPPALVASAAAPSAVTGTSLGTSPSASYDASSSYLAALNESLATIPNAADSERSRPYTPSNPYPTPSCYPAVPHQIFENPAVFEKLGTDCLFFIFYYAQGTYQQYLAARELKKQSWRFHKKFMTWFQRHEEPKVTTDEYEQGTYVYFDYESGWCTRIKADFRFEYVYLEDSLQ